MVYGFKLFKWPYLFSFVHTFCHDNTKQSTVETIRNKLLYIKLLNSILKINLTTVSHKCGYNWIYFDYNVYLKR